MTAATISTVSTSRSVRLVDRIARRLAPDHDHESRRGFLVRAAVLGTALAANPLRLLLRPGTAYASVCGGGAACGDGWTVMCCTINGGANTCPPGSFPAGWWKADNSAFCAGQPRYYVDCNRLPWAPSACGCHCHADPATCDQRRVCCNVFRYGQCHLEVGGVTPVVCRVILCTPPWEWDPACSASSRTDAQTASHSAPCLPGTDATAIQLKYQDLGLVGSGLGRQTGPETAAPAGGVVASFENGVIAWRPDVGAHEIRGDIKRRHDEVGGLAGMLGYPVTDELAVGDGRGRFSQFTGGAILWRPDLGAFEIHGAIGGHYLGLGGVRHPLGYPVSNEEALPGDAAWSRFESGAILWRADLGPHATWGDIARRYFDLGGPSGWLGLPLTDEGPIGRGRVSWMQGGAVFWTPQVGAHAVRNPILHRWFELGGPGHALGFPIAEDQVIGGGAQQLFEGGSFLFRSGQQPVAVWGQIHFRWRQLAGPDGDLGFPITDELPIGDGRGRVSWFDGGAVFWTPTTGAQDIQNPILTAWFERGGPTGRLGYPITGYDLIDATHRRVRFERGTLVADLATGAVVEQ